MHTALGFVLQDSHACGIPSHATASHRLSPVHQASDHLVLTLIPVPLKSWYLVESNLRAKSVGHIYSAEKQPTCTHRKLPPLARNNLPILIHARSVSTPYFHTMHHLHQLFCLQSMSPHSQPTTHFGGEHPPQTSKNGSRHLLQKLRCGHHRGVKGPI